MAPGGTKCKIVPGAWEPSLGGKATQTSLSTIPYSQKNQHSKNTAKHSKKHSKNTAKNNTDELEHVYKRQHRHTDTDELEHASVFSNNS